MTSLREGLVMEKSVVQVTNTENFRKAAIMSKPLTRSTHEVEFSGIQTEEGKSKEDQVRSEIITTINMTVPKQYVQSLEDTNSCSDFIEHESLSLDSIEVPRKSSNFIKYPVNSRSSESLEVSTVRSVVSSPYLDSKRTRKENFKSIRMQSQGSGIEKSNICNGSSIPSPYLTFMQFPTQTLKSIFSPLEKPNFRDHPIKYIQQTVGESCVHTQIQCSKSLETASEGRETHKPIEFCTLDRQLLKRPREFPNRVSQGFLKERAAKSPRISKESSTKCMQFSHECTKNSMKLSDTVDRMEESKSCSKRSLKKSHPCSKITTHQLRQCSKSVHLNNFCRLTSPDASCPDIESNDSPYWEVVGLSEVPSLEAHEKCPAQRVTLPGLPEGMVLKIYPEPCPGCKRIEHIDPSVVFDGQQISLYHGALKFHLSATNSECENCCCQNL